MCGDNVHDAIYQGVRYALHMYSDIDASEESAPRPIVANMILQNAYWSIVVSSSTLHVGIINYTTLILLPGLCRTGSPNATPQYLNALF